MKKIEIEIFDKNSKTVVLRKVLDSKKFSKFQEEFKQYFKGDLDYKVIK